MNLLYFLLCNFLFFQPIYSFQKYTFPPINSNLQYFKQNNLILYSNKTPNKTPNKNPNTNFNIITKMNSISKLIRSVNILPTLFLTFSGGWIIEPSIKTLLYSSQFISANVISLLVMSLSMVINDIYDIDLDKINNPSRPLITGEITKREATLFSVVLLCTIKCLSLLFLSCKLDKIVNIILFGIAAYTPIIKKIPFIKNIFCAIIVSFSMYYSGLAVQPNMTFETINFSILLTTIRYIFLGSLTVELLLDISDMEGDKKNNINTLPVLIGKKGTWSFIFSLIVYNIYNVISIININTINIILIKKEFLLIFILFLPIIIDMYNIRKSNFEKEVINNAVKNTTIPMFLMLLYMCFLANENLHMNMLLSKL
jgi:4-hydroxybenzoate polyprenyltransferase